MLSHTGGSAQACYGTDPISDVGPMNLFEEIEIRRPPDTTSPHLKISTPFEHTNNVKKNVAKYKTTPKSNVQYNSRRET